MPSPTGPLMTVDRVHAARALAAERDTDLLVITPGSDLRYLTGYNAHALERLTALAVPSEGEPFLVVPRLEAPMVGVSPAGALGLDVLAWDETDDPFALLAGALDAVVGGGGLVQLPALLVVLPQAPVVSLLGTNTLASVVGTASAAVAYNRRVAIHRPTAASGLDGSSSSISGSQESTPENTTMSPTCTSLNR